MDSQSHGVFSKLVFVVTIGTLIILSLCLKSYDQTFWTSTAIQLKINHYKELSYVLIFVTLGLINVLVGEIIVRSVIFLEELRYIRRRYDGNVCSVIQQSFSAKTNVPLFTLPILVAIMTYLNLKGDGMLVVWRILLTKWNCTFIISISLIPYLLKLHTPTVSQLNRILQEQKMNVGHGFAWSFYFGYLRLIIPGLHSRIDSWTKTNITDINQKLKVIPKLYILIPKSCYCPPSITAADPHLKVAGVTPSFVANRAGTQRREYKNTVYCFESDGMVYYCLVEYATPILSLYEMSNSKEAGLSSYERLQQMNTFVSTLQEIINSNPDTKNYCSLVVFDDKKPDGSEQSVTELLKERIDIDLKEQALTKSF